MLDLYDEFEIKDILMPINPKLMTLVSLLSDGRYYSGEQLGESISVSRAAVWKYLQQLEGLGLKLLSRKGLGYCLSDPLELLDHDLVVSRLDEAALCDVKHIHLQPLIDSTNQYLMDLSAKGESISGLIAASEKQTDGRGRRGRVWHSPFAKNIYLSFGWRFHNGVKAVEGLSLAVGVAVCRALSSIGVASAQLKWPNDILINGCKLGGVLIELSGDMGGDCDVVVGIGLNVHMMSDDNEGSPTEIDQPWTSVVNAHFALNAEKSERVDLDDIGSAVNLFSRNHLLSQLINEVLLVLSRYETDRFEFYKSDFQSLHAFQGKAVSLVSGDKVVVGIVEGVSDQGGILLCIDGGEVCEFHGGEVSLRAAL